jgi:hypothetical protein
MANQILAGAVFNAGQVIAGVDANNPPYVGPAAEIVVPSEVGNFVTILDSGTMEVTHTLTNPYPNGQNWGMTANSNDRSLYVTGYIDGHPNYVKSTVIYDLDNLSAGHVEPTGGSKVYSNIAFTDGKAFAIVSPDGSHIGRELAEIDPTTLEKISVIPNPSGIASESGFLGGPLFAHGGKVYKGDTDYQGSQNGTSNGKVFVFDAADGSLLQEISSPSTSSNYPDINRFGSNIAVKDSWVAVTGYTTKNASGMSIGSVHVYDANNLGGSPTELFASNDQRFFGSDLAISGDYVFVGSKSEDGSDGRVHVFDMSAGGSLVISLEVADIFHADADMFGSYIVANETHLFVNAPYHRHQTTLEYVGAVHKFAISDLSGSYESALGETNAQFQVSGGLTNFDITDLPVSESSSGGSTSSSASWLVVGAPKGYRPDGSRTGEAYVFDATDLSAAPTVIESPTTDDQFAGEVSVSNDKIFVAHREEDNQKGAVYVYDATDLSATPTKITAPDAEDQDQFGRGLSVFGDTVVVGAWRDDEASTSNTGSLYVYDATDLSAAPTKLTHSNAEANDYLGRSVAVSDDYVVGGAYGVNTSGGNTGAVYVWDKSDLSAAPTKLVPNPSATPSQLLGYNVSLHGNTLIASNHSENNYQGEVYVYDMTDLSAAPTELTSPSGQPWDFFGAGDDTDGIVVHGDTIVIGAKGDHSNGGAVFVYDATDLSAAPTELTNPYNTTHPLFAGSVSVFGDMLVVGSERGPLDGNVDADYVGKVYVYDLNDLSAAPTELVPSNETREIRFGESVALG